MRTLQKRLVVPRSQLEFSYQIHQWLARWVQSRTVRHGHPVHRERDLLRDNRSLEELWRQISPFAGTSFIVVANLIGDSRVTAVVFNVGDDTRGSGF